MSSNVSAYFSAARKSHSFHTVFSIIHTSPPSPRSPSLSGTFREALKANPPPPCHKSRFKSPIFARAIDASTAHSLNIRVYARTHIYVCLSSVRVHSTLTPFSRLKRIYPNGKFSDNYPVAASVCVRDSIFSSCKRAKLLSISWLQQEGKRAKMSH